MGKNLKYPDDKYILLDIAKNKDLPGLIAETAASLIPVSEEPAMAKQIALSGNDAASKLFIDCLKMPEDKDYIMNADISMKVIPLRKSVLSVHTRRVSLS